MNRKKLAIYAVAGVALMWAVLFLTRFGEQGAIPARGKSPAQTLSEELTPEQQAAQDLALSDPRVLSLTAGQRSEVMGIKLVGMHFPESSRACARADCRQVEIYNFDENAAVTAIVNLDTHQVLDVLHQPGVHPGINQRLFGRALAIIAAAPEVAETLGYVPRQDEMALMEGDMPGSSCAGEHLCVAATFRLGDRILWAFADLTSERFAGINWTSASEETGTAVFFGGQGCPQPGTVNLDGWALSYETTSSDGLRVYDVTYNGSPVLTSVKLVEWHVDYGNTGFRDSTGCGSGGGGFPISPFGETQVLDLFENGVDAGFEVVQDFRMPLWGETCNYRYEQHVQFFADGRFRVVSGAFGKGCAALGLSLYRPVTRIDIAVNGDANDTFSYWDGSQWVALGQEDYRVPYTETGHGPHQTTPEGFAWRVDDQSGAGYFIEMDTGQYDGENGRGANPFLYATLHNPAEGDTDLGVIGVCCNDDHQQGPDDFLNNETISSANLVLWYISQSQTDDLNAENGYYCWTISGEPNPETYPCFTGPTFYPASFGTLAGQVTLQGRSDDSQASLTASGSNGLVYSRESDPAGNFGLAIPPGTYDVAVEMNGYLDAFLPGVIITQSATTSLPTVTLPGGDADDSDFIDILDLAFIAARFGLACGDPGWDDRADIIPDCSINIQDLTVSSGNFNQGSPVPWP